MLTHQQWLFRFQAEQNKQRAADRNPQIPLPFGDGCLDDEPQWHGAGEGLRRHTLAGERPCALCAGFIAELIDAGLACVVEEGGTQ